MGVSGRPRPGVGRRNSCWWLPTASSAVSAYALGVIVGATTLTLIGARCNRRMLAILLITVVGLANASSAMVTAFPALLVTRFLSGLPHGAYFGTVALLAASLVAPERRARAIATSMSSLMTANILGVPFATWLGLTLGWRSCYIAVAAVAVLALGAIAALVPPVSLAPDEDRGVPARTQLAALRQARTLLTLATICIGFGGMFAAYTFVDPVMKQAGLNTEWLPLVLMLFGVAMTVGNWVGGHLADRCAVGTIATGLVLAALVQVAFLLAAGTATGTVTTFGLLGFVVIATTPALTIRLIDVAQEGRDSPRPSVTPRSTWPTASAPGSPESWSTTSSRRRIRVSGWA